MPRKARAPAVLLTLGLLAAPGLGAGAEKKPGSAPSQTALDKDPAQDLKEKQEPETAFEFLAETAELVGKTACRSGKAQLTATIDAALGKALKARRDQRERVVKESLDGINFAAAAALADTPEGAIGLHNAVSALNTSAGNYVEGRRFADKALERYPEDRQALVNRSNANFGLGRYADSFKDADKAARVDPDNPDVYRARAMAHYGLRRYLEASEDARRALALDPDDKTAFAIMRLSEGKVPALSLDQLKSPMGGEIQREYHGMVQQQNQAEERRHAPAETPAAPSTERLVRVAASRLAVKDYRGAISDADRALELDPNSPKAYYYRAAARNLLGQYEAAADDASRGLVIAPADPALRDARAWAFNRLGRFRDAMADSNHSLQVNPQNAYAFANLAYSLEQTGDLAGMLRELKTAAAINPQFEPAYRDAAARHGLQAETSLSDRLPPPSAPSRRQASRRRSFLVILASSLVGGILIAGGLVQFGLVGRSAAKPGRGGSRLLEAGYELGKPIGRGGMGVVFEAWDRTLQRKVAVKMMRDDVRLDAKARARLLAEARTVAALHHPGIVDIHSIVEDEEGLSLVFELVAGRNLEELLAERKRLTLTEAKAVLKQVCQALDYAHRHRVVHRDLKPSNIMITEQGQAKVMDFGISRHSLEAVGPMGSAPATQHTHSALGTPFYMAPEQEYGVIRKENDIFSLGACLYEMMTGRRPFSGPACSEQKITREYAKASSLEPGLPAELDALIDDALHPDPDQRIRGARDFWARLELIQEPAARPGA